MYESLLNKRSIVLLINVIFAITNPQFSNYFRFLHRRTASREKEISPKRRQYGRKE